MLKHVEDWPEWSLRPDTRLQLPSHRLSLVTTYQAPVTLAQSRSHNHPHTITTFSFTVSTKFHKKTTLCSAGISIPTNVWVHFSKPQLFRPCRGAAFSVWSKKHWRHFDPFPSWIEIEGGIDLLSGLSVWGVGTAPNGFAQDTLKIYSGTGRWRTLYLSERDLVWFSGTRFLGSKVWHLLVAQLQHFDCWLTYWRMSWIRLTLHSRLFYQSKTMAVNQVAFNKQSGRVQLR